MLWEALTNLRSILDVGADLSPEGLGQFHRLGKCCALLRDSKIYSVEQLIKCSPTQQKILYTVRKSDGTNIRHASLNRYFSVQQQVSPDFLNYVYEACKVHEITVQIKY